MEGSYISVLPAILKSHNLQVYKTFAVGLLVLISVISFGQSKGGTTNVLSLNHKKYFKETNRFINDTAFIFKLRISYNEPNVIDEEFSHVLTIKIFDTSKPTKRKTFDILRDTSLIKCKYDRVSVWNWGNQNTYISGQVTIASQAKNKIELEFALTVIDPNHDRTLVYQGKRTFDKTNKLERYP